MKKFFKCVREVFLFSIPVVAGKLSEILFGIGDVIVAGRYSTLVLGALGVASAFLFPILVFGTGIMSAISAIKSRRIGAGECTAPIPSSSLWLSIVIGFLLTLVGLAVSRWVVPLFGYEPEFEKLVQIYLTICAPSIIPALIFAAMREVLLARSHTVVPNVLILLFNIFNVGANILLMFTLGLGIAGAAISTLLSRILMAIAITLYSRKKTQWKWTLCSDTVYEVLKQGLPTGGITLAVSSVFAVVALLVGKMSFVAAATNNVVINVTAFTFMIPLALSGVTAVKVGHSFGAKRLDLVREYAAASTFIGVVVATIGGSLFFFFPESILRIFTNQQSVIDYGTGLLLFIAIYQIPDAVQEIYIGALRGIGKTTVTLWLCIICVWLIGLPVGCYFAYVREMEAAGLWLGLTVGLCVLSVVLGTYLYASLKRLEHAASADKAIKY